MATITRQHGYDVWTIRSSGGQLSASFVPALGGIGRSLEWTGRTGPRELLFCHDFFWNPDTPRIRGGWPFLFPVCGRLLNAGEHDCYLHQGKLYRLCSHGFGPHLPWEAEAEGENSLLLRLRDTAITRALYPFAFEVTLRYRLEDDALSCEQTFHNRGSHDLLYSAGFHPYFLTPPPGAGKEQVTLSFQAMETFDYDSRPSVILHPANPLPAPITSETKRFNSSISRLGPEKEVQVAFPDGLILRMAAAGVEDPDLFAFLQLYTMPDKPFVCAEPWIAPPHSLNVEGRARPLRAGETEHGVLRLRLNEPSA